MSKLYKKVIALVMAIALLVPGLSALANPQVFPGWGEDAPEHGSITVVRIAGAAGDYTLDSDDNVVPTPPGHFIPGAIVRVQLVELINPSQPTNAENTTPVLVEGEPVYFYEVTGTNGEAVFNNLPLGIWLVSEVATIPGSEPAVTSPVNPDHMFEDFLVSLPRYTGAAAVECPEYGTPEYDEDCEEKSAVLGDFEFDVRVYPKSEIPTYEGTYKNLVEVSGNVARWELSHRIPNSVATLPYFGVTDLMSAGLQFVPESVVGRFTATGDESNNWEDVSGVLVYGDHFEVEASANGRRVDISITEEGREFLAEFGILGTGDVMFRLDTAIVRAGSQTNYAFWNVGEAPCPVDDPECDLVPPCDPIEDEDCDPEPPCDPEEDPECDYDPIVTFSLELTKVNPGNQALQGAEFRLYRELTAAELALPAADRPAGTINNGTEFVTPIRNLAGTTVEGTTGANGITNFNGVPMSSVDHNIWIRELVAPTGYRIVDEWMQVNVDADHATTGTFTVPVTVVNQPEGDGWDLPQTGGVGTVLLTVAGLALVGGALVLFVGSKKEEEA